MNMMMVKVMVMMMAKVMVMMMMVVVVVRMTLHHPPLCAAGRSCLLGMAGAACPPTFSALYAVGVMTTHKPHH
jgi:hypothetical protein